MDFKLKIINSKLKVFAFGTSTHAKVYKSTSTFASVSLM